MNSTFTISQLGIGGGDTYMPQTRHLALLYESLVRFLIAGLVAGILGSRKHVLHGELNILFMLCTQGTLTPPKVALLGVIIGRRISAFFTTEHCDRVEDGGSNNRQLQPTTREGEIKKDSVVHQDSFLKPIIFPSRTTHRRLFPTPHAFGYSYLLVGIPVSDTTQIESNSMLSSHPMPNSDVAVQTPPAWFSVYATDYLQRGTAFSHLNLRQKLDRYLEAEGWDPALCPYAYLVTAPRFLGFSFNPVSFWYLYDEKRTLAAMILEVNNTFDERRMYLLQRSQHHSADVGNTENGETEESPRFTQRWNKDFHVSPFNDREGSYSLSANDLAVTNALDNTIVLRSDNDKAKVIARVFSTKQGIDPVTMSFWRRTIFLMQWFWVGFMTNPRILKEARILWVKKLQVFYRPEPFKSTIGRKETSEEITVEKCFQQVLSHVARREGVVIEYWPAAGDQRATCIILGDNDNSKRTAPVKLRVLTPEFYAELVREPRRILSLLGRVCFQNHTETQGSCDPLAWIDNENAVRKLFHTSKDGNNKESKQLDTRHENGRLSKHENAVALLRRKEVSLLTIMSQCCAAALGFQGSGQVSSRSEMDAAIKEVMSSSEYYLYLWSALTILLCDRLAFGFMALFRLEIRIVRLITVMISTQLLISALKMVLDMTSSNLRSYVKGVDGDR